MNFSEKNFAIFCFLTIFLASCGDDSGSSAKNSESIEEKTISGVAQLGPFEKGATVAAFELDEDLKQTGFNIESAVLNDQGEYSINLKDLESPYALLKADGYYRSPVTGERTNEKATLYTLADLENDSEFNINILTHLSHKRAIYLATEKNKPVAKAKKQAEAEVLKSFGIDEEFDDAATLNIIGKDNQSIALLAMSIMMQSDIAETELKERLANYATDIEEDGTWDDKAMTAKIADWAYKVYYYSAFGTIKDYVKKWNSSAVFATFEKYVNRFWHHHYGLGVCTDDRINEVRKNDLFTSDFEDKYFICRPGGKWKEASTSEFLKYFKIDENATDGMERSVQTSTNKMECQVYEDGEWRKGNDSDCNLGFGGCTKKREGMTTTKTTYNAIYQWTCKNQEWISTLKKIMYNDSVFIQPVMFDIDTLGWKDTTDGTIRKGNFSDIIYIFDKDSWRVANIPEASLGKCTHKNLDSAGYAEYRDGQVQLDPLSFACNYNMQLHHTYDNCSNSTYQSGYYKCDHTIIEDSKAIYAWAVVENKYLLDKYDLKDGKLIRWKNGKEGETRWGNFRKEDCKSKTTYNSRENVCQQKCYEFTDGEWIQAPITQCMGLGTCNDKLKGKVKEGPVVKSQRICLSLPETTYDYCYNVLIEVDSLNKTNYVCYSDKTYEQESSGSYISPEIYDPTPATGKWIIATDFNIETAQLECPKDGALVSIKADSLKEYVCDEYGFRLAKETEIMVGLGCTYFTEGKKYHPSGLKSYFECSIGDYGNFTWYFAPSDNQATMTDSRDSKVYKTLNIGSKTWMMENLNYADSANYPSMLEKSKCKNDSLDNCKKYGRLYTWSAAIDSVYWASKGKICGNTKESGTKCELPEVVQGICPQGWHVPSIQEWEDLVLWQSYFASMETFRNDNFIPTKEEHHDFWTSSESTKSITYSAYLEKYTSERNYNIEQNFKEPKDTPYSVRCVKDN